MLSVGVEGKEEEAGGGVEMITINKGLAGVIADFIRQQEMESRCKGRFLCSRNLYGSNEEPKLQPSPTQSSSSFSDSEGFSPSSVSVKRKMFSGFCPFSKTDEFLILHLTVKCEHFILTKTKQMITLLEFSDISSSSWPAACCQSFRGAVGKNKSIVVGEIRLRSSFLN